MGEESPKNKVKFLCSYGGKVLPRSSDGILKYVGGETRVICVPRDVTFSELMKKVSCMVDIGEVVLKYQLAPEDLDTLVSVRTQEDVKHMMEEHDRHETGGSPLLRAFLFPSKPLLVDINLHVQQQPLPVEPYLLEQRYVDAINGIIRRSPSSRETYSACCSPKSNSPKGHTTTNDSPFHSLNQSLASRLTLHKVRSSPSLSNLTTTSSTSTTTTNNNNNNIQPHHHDHHAIPHYNHPLLYPPSSTSSFASRQDHQMEVGGGGGGGARLPHVITDRGYNYYYSTTTRQHHKSCAYHEDSAIPYAATAGSGDRVMIERVNSVPRSRSPRNTFGNE